MVFGQARSLRQDVLLDPRERLAGRMLTCTDEAISDLHLDLSDVVVPGNITARTFPCRIAALERVAPDVIRVLLRLPPAICFRSVAGQSLDVIDPSGTRRSYSIANAPDRNGESTSLELHVRAVPGGLMSAYWFERARVNDLLRLVGPRGTFFLPRIAGLDLVFLGTGTGIAPIKSMLEVLDVASPEDSPRSICLYWGGRVPADLYWDPRALPRLALRYTPVLSRAASAWPGRRGHVQEVLLADGFDPATSMVVACGSPLMIDSARSRLVEAGLPSTRFLSDAFVASN